MDSSASTEKPSEELEDVIVDGKSGGSPNAVDEIIIRSLPSTTEVADPPQSGAVAISRKRKEQARSTEQSDSQALPFLVSRFAIKYLYGSPGTLFSFVWYIICSPYRSFVFLRSYFQPSKENTGRESGSSPSSKFPKYDEELGLPPSGNPQAVDDDSDGSTSPEIPSRKIIESIPGPVGVGPEGTPKFNQWGSKGIIYGQPKYAEQVLYIICKTALREAQFIRYDMKENSDWGDYMFLMTPNLEDSRVGTVQRVMEFSLAFNGNIKMAGVPNPAYILGMPRSNRILIHYEAVIPNRKINIEEHLHPSKCGYCEIGADWDLQTDPGSTETPATIFVCERCLLAKKHAHSRINLDERKIVSRKQMQLISIMCIRGCHFVAFVLDKSTRGNNNKEEDGTWYFFDSMAGGYPEVKTVPEMSDWLDKLGDDPDKFHTENIHPLVKRSLTDGHLCIYEPVLYKQ